VRPYVDARNWTAQEKRSALVRWADHAILVTASWGKPTLVQRPDGSFRRKYLVHLLVPPEHRELPFHQVTSVALCLTGDRPSFITEAIEGVASRETNGVTLAMFVDDQH